jgi:hypothetical protein
MVTIIGVRHDAISRLVLMSKELCDSPLTIKKSSRSGVLLANKLVRLWVLFLTAFLLWVGIVHDISLD